MSCTITPDKEPGSSVANIALLCKGCDVCIALTPKGER